MIAGSSSVEPFAYVIGSIRSPDDVIATGEEFLEQFASRHVLVVVEIHIPREGEELVDRFMSDAEFSVMIRVKSFRSKVVSSEN